MRYSFVLALGLFGSLAIGGVAVGQTPTRAVPKISSSTPSAPKEVAPTPSTPMVSAPAALRLGRSPAEGATHQDEPRMIAPEPSVLKAVASVVNAPKIELGIEPLEADAILYHPVAGKTLHDPSTGQVSVVLGIKNKESKSIKLQRVKFSYAGGSKEVVINVSIAPNTTEKVQNNRAYHADGDVLYLSSPLPSTLTIELSFDGFSVPVKVTKALKPYPQSFSPPFKQSELGANEFWESASTHGGGSQVFAYDLGVEAYVNNGWSHLHPGKKDDKNEHFRVWGKRIYAMADGEVKHSLNECPENKSPGTSDEAVWKQYQRGGAGNHFYIQHGEVIALYAHMQKGSLNKDLLKVGTKVKKGDFLGLAGNSGSSSAPHLHIHVRKETSVESGPFRPLLLKDAFAIEKASYTKPKSNVNWSKLSGSGIPGFKGQRSYIWASATHPYCEHPNAGLVAKHGVSEADYQKVFDSIWTCGLRPTWIDGFDVGGKTYFNMVFQKEDAPWVARHGLTAASYQTEFEKWHKEGFKLANVDSYLQGGSVRYTAVWSKASSPAVVAYHGVDDVTHQKKFDELTKDGWVPVNASSVAPNDKRQVTALYRKANVNGFYAHSSLSLDQYKEKFKQYGDQGFKLVYLNGYVQSGKPMLSAIWYKTAPFGAYIAKHHLTGADYQKEFGVQSAAGFNIFAVTGYASGGAARYEGLWVK